MQTSDWILERLIEIRRAPTDSKENLYPQVVAKKNILKNLLGQFYFLYNRTIDLSGVKAEDVL